MQLKQNKKNISADTDAVETEYKKEEEGKEN